MIDVIVVGGGIAGLAASLFTQKAGLRTIVFDTGVSQLKKVSAVWNYMGKTGNSGEQMIEDYRNQVTNVGVELRDEEVLSVTQEEDSFVVQTAAETYSAKYVIIATNLNTQLLADLGFELVVNEKVPSGKIKQVKGIGWEGVTQLPNLYVAGLLAGVPSQAIIAAGQGAAVGVDIAAKATGKTYMWHDV